MKFKKQMLKKMIMMSLAAVMAVGIAGCGSSTSNGGGGNANEAKIALLTATSGGAAAYGESIKNRAELDVEQINKDSNSVKINLIVEDTKGDKNEAINAMNKVIHKDNVVVGPNASQKCLRDRLLIRARS